MLKKLSILINEALPYIINYFNIYSTLDRKRKF